VPAPTLLVPAGAEAAAVRHGAPDARIVELRAGPAAAALPPLGPEPVVVLGLCGALRRYRAGEIVVYHRVVGEARWFECDEALVSEVLPDAPRVVACTTPHVVTTIAERDALAACHDADVVDMEGIALAAALSARGLRYAMVRVVSDDARRDLPALGAAIAPDGTLRPFHVALAFVRAPRAAYAFVRDVQGALASLRALARTVSRASA
jgi:purine nucleoside phosphorylase